MSARQRRAGDENKRMEEMEEIECVVGAGVVGLAAARALALAGRPVPALDRAPTVGFETSATARSSTAASLPPAGEAVRQLFG
jgi:glycine/D-amino acid oxidase-like deaminating enzyme